MTLAVAALFAEGTTAIRDVYNWRVKETERMKVRVCLLMCKWVSGCFTKRDPQSGVHNWWVKDTERTTVGFWF